MKTIKKLFALVVIAGSALLTLAACAKDQTSTDLDLSGESGKKTSETRPNIKGEYRYIVNNSDEYSIRTIIITEDNYYTFKFYAKFPSGNEYNQETKYSYKFLSNEIIEAKKVNDEKKAEYFLICDEGLLTLTIDTVYYTKVKETEDETNKRE